MTLRKRKLTSIFPEPNIRRPPSALTAVFNLDQGLYGFLVTFRGKRPPASAHLHEWPSEAYAYRDIFSRDISVYHDGIKINHFLVSLEKNRVLIALA